MKTSAQTIQSKLQIIYQSFQSIKTLGLVDGLGIITKFIPIDCRKLSDSEMEELMSLAKNWNGKIYLHAEKCQKSSTYYWRLYFGETDIPFYIQLCHRTVKSSVSVGDLIISDFATSFYAEKDKKYGYYNGGVLNLALKMGIPLTEESKPLDLAYHAD